MRGRSGADIRAIVGLLTLVLAGCSMASGKKCLFSELEGVVLADGAPLQGAKVVQTYHWQWADSRGERSETTDAQGRFRFPAVFGKSLTASFIPHEPVISQRVMIEHGGSSYKGWLFTKHDYTVNGERNGKPLRLRCDIHQEAGYHGEAFGVCTVLDET